MYTYTCKTKTKWRTVVVYTFNPSTREVVEFQASQVYREGSRTVKETVWTKKKKIVRRGATHL